MYVRKCRDRIGLDRRFSFWMMMVLQVENVNGCSVEVARRLLTYLE